ncbi:hypothetical protein PILCRDRAFT_816874 [Piloderma croceum F 1598]|uniref:Uncharacterized protein n=1 Tax=Piloderma croceum (strain F 1598) TaxID=765440 RepID=A0A0C3BHA1_PILCF|nr:hypothetical protein PILCRDRAFT_816874 [Piloderma croceum F 1598]
MGKNQPCLQQICILCGNPEFSYRGRIVLVDSFVSCCAILGSTVDDFETCDMMVKKTLRSVLISITMQPGRTTVSGPELKIAAQIGR